MKNCGKSTDKGTCRQYLEDSLPKELAALVHDYLVPTLGDKKILFASRKPLSFSILPDKSAAILFDRDVCVMNNKGKSRMWSIGNNYWDQLRVQYNKVLVLNESTIAFGNSRELNIVFHSTRRILWRRKGLHAVSLCATLEGNLAALTPHGNILFYSSEGNYVDSWRVKIPGFQMEESSFAMLPHNQIALVCNTSKYLVLFDQTNKMGPNMERYQWRDYKKNKKNAPVNVNGDDLVQVFYSDYRKEIMIFDRQRQLICCCDLSGHFLYNLDFRDKSNAATTTNTTTTDSAFTTSTSFVEQVFVCHDKLAFLERGQDDKYMVMVASILG